MTETELNQMWYPIIITQDGIIVQRNGLSQRHFPQWNIGDTLPLTQPMGRAEGVEQIYDYYTSSEGENQVLYFFKEGQQPLPPSKTSQLYRLMREDLQTIQSSSMNLWNAQEDGDINKKVEKCLSVILHRTAHLERMIENAELYQESSIEVRIVDVAGILRECAVQVQSSVGIALTIDSSQVEDSILVKGNRLALRRMFFEMCNNTARHKGVLALSLQKTKTHCLIRAEDNKALEQDVVQILEGITARGVRLGDGAGMGLPTIRSLARSMGYQVLGERGAGGGLVLIVAIPLPTVKETKIFSDTMDVLDEDTDDILRYLSPILEDDCYHPNQFD